MRSTRLCGAWKELGWSEGDGNLVIEERYPRGGLPSVGHAILSGRAVVRLPPMRFGHIRWNKSLGALVGDPATGYSPSGKPFR